MSNSNSFPTVKLGTLLWLSGLSLILLWCFACKDEASPEIVEPPVVSLLDSVIGVHDGSCHFIDKNLATGVVYADTTYDSALEIVRINSELVQATGCGAPQFSFVMPDTSTSLMFYGQSTYQGYSGSITIDLSIRTITTSGNSYGTNLPSPYRKEWSGKYKF